MSGFSKYLVRTLVRTAKNTKKFFTIPEVAESSKIQDIKIQDIIKSNKLGLTHPSNYYLFHAHQPAVFQNLWGGLRNKALINADATSLARVDYFIASLISPHGFLEGEDYQPFHFPPVFNIKLNGELIEPISTDSVEKTSFEFLHEESGLWVSCTDNILKFCNYTRKSKETVFLSHAVHIEAHQQTPQMKNNNVKSIPSILISDIERHNSEITFKQKEYVEETHIINPPTIEAKKTDLTQDFLYETLLIDDYYFNHHTNDFKNKKGATSVGLQFPMTLSLKSNPQTIHIEELGDTFTVYHKINIQATKELIDRKESMKCIDYGCGKIRIGLTSGELLMRTRGFFNDNFKMQFEAFVAIDFKRPGPAIAIQPSSTASCF